MTTTQTVGALGAAQTASNVETVTFDNWIATELQVFDSAASGGKGASKWVFKVGIPSNRKVIDVGYGSVQGVAIGSVQNFVSGRVFEAITSIPPKLGADGKLHYSEFHCRWLFDVASHVLYVQAPAMAEYVPGYFVQSGFSVVTAAADPIVPKTVGAIPTIPPKIPPNILGLGPEGKISIPFLLPIGEPSIPLTVGALPPSFVQYATAQQIARTTNRGGSRTVPKAPARSTSFSFGAMGLAASGH